MAYIVIKLFANCGVTDKEEMRDEKMLNKIEHTGVPMIVTPVWKALVDKNMIKDPSAEHPKDTVFLENRKEIKSHRVYEKGLFIDFYA